jgi:flagellar biosynthesis protein FliP
MTRAVALLVVLLASLAPALPARAQAVYGPPAPGAAAPAPTATPMPQSTPAAEGFSSFNPIGVMEGAAESIPGMEGGLVGAINILVLLTVLSLAPAIMVMTTSFVRIIIVLGLLKQAMGTQMLPPAQVTFGLALIMTFLVMTPTMERVWEEAVGPYQRGEIVNQLEMWDKAKQPLRDFMFDQLEATGNWSGLYMVMNYRGMDTSEPEALTRADVDTLSLISAFMLSELKVAFIMGFRIYLPFLVIDMVIASLLISMSMMMLPPVLISLPFKLLLFVLVDGWQLVIGALLMSFAQPDAATAAATGAG